LDGDCPLFKIAKELPQVGKRKGIGQDVSDIASAGQLMVKLVKDELTSL